MPSSESSQPIRILAVDDHPVFRGGLAAIIIQTQLDMALVGEAGTGREGIELFRRLKPDVTLMDLQMPDMRGLEAIKVIRTEYPQARIIVLTTYWATSRRSKHSRQAPRDICSKARFTANCWIRSGVSTPDVVTCRPRSQATSYFMPAKTSRLHGRSKSAPDRQWQPTRIAARLSLSEETVKGYLKKHLPEAWLQ